MLDLNNPEHRQILLNAGVPQDKVDAMYEKQKRGEKLSSWIMINIDGKDKIIRIPESSEEINTRKVLYKKARERKNRIQREIYKERNFMNEEQRKEKRRLRAYNRAVGNFWKQVNKKGENECWKWTGSTTLDGYGLLGFNRKTIRAHVFSCKIHGIEIPKEYEVSHTCDNPSCVNPKHLVPKTHRDNVKESFYKGRHTHIYEKNPNSILTKGQVEQIRQEYFRGGITQKELAKKYGVKHISRIINNKSWKTNNIINNKKPNNYSKGERVNTAKLKQGQPTKIREEYRIKKITQRKLAKKYGVSHMTISDIINNKRWKDDKPQEMN